MKVVLKDVPPSVLDDGDDYHAIRIALPSGKELLVYTPANEDPQISSLPHGSTEVDHDGDPVWLDAKPAGRGSHVTTVDGMSDQEVRRTLKKLQEDYRAGLAHESSEDIATFVHDTLQEAGLDVSPHCEEEDHEG